LIDRRDARPLATWTVPEPLVDHDDRPAFVPDDSGHFLVRCGSRVVARIVPSIQTAEVLVHAERDLAPRAVDRLGGLLWLAERGGGYTVASAMDGRVLWRVDLGQQLVSSVASAGGGFVVAGESGSLFRVKSDGQVTGVSGLPRRSGLCAIFHLLGCS